MKDKNKLLFQVEVSTALIEIWNNHNQRWLNINGIEQSRINLDSPELLASPLHHYFLSSLLFSETPKKVLLGGLGGGSLARYLHHIQPEIKGTAVEINQTIVSLAKEYFYFPENQWNIINDDFQRYEKGRNDLIIADIAEEDLTPKWLSSEETLLKLKRQLSNSGILTMNFLVADAPAFSHALKMIRKVFDYKTLCVSVPDHKNIIIFAFNQRPDYRVMEELESRAIRLSKVWRIDFRKLLKQLVKDNPKNSGIF